MLGTCQSFGKCLIRMQSLPLTFCPSSGLLSKSFPLQSSCYSFTPCISPSMVSWLWVWNYGKGADKLSVQLAILLTVLPKLTAVLTTDPATESLQEFPVWHSFILATAKPFRNLSCVCQVWSVSVMPGCYFNSLKFPSKGFFICPARIVEYTSAQIWHTRGFIWFFS